MFTGIIRELGKVRSLSVQQESAQLTIAARAVLSDVRLGDSIAVNGVCLTVTSFSSHEFTVDIMPETLRKTNLIKLKSGDRVNLEPALAFGGRLGGHFVSGHIDGVGTIGAKRVEGNAVIYIIMTSDAVLDYIIPKGSVAIDGISLTVAARNENSFYVSVIPHTASLTTLGCKRVGDPVNLENDMIGKYVAHLLFSRQETKQKEEVSIDLLKEHGFI